MISELQNISAAILNSHKSEHEVAHTNDLVMFYSALLDSLKIDTYSTEFTDINGGVALSPQHAIDCLRDGVRTSRFLKGIHKAIAHLLETKKGETLEIVYAGCGPFATLLVPLLPHFKPDQLKVTLLDIHKESIISSKKIIEHLELTNFQIAFHVCDATTYAHPEKIDLLISETMDKGLTREPQVSITEHLCQFLAPEGILIPKKISLYSARAAFSSLPNHKTHLHEEVTIDYEHFLFSANRSSQISRDGFESAVIDRSNDIDSKPDLCVFTEVEIFDGIFLKTGDALITDPICILFPNLAETKKYHICYTSKPVPAWSIKQKNGTE